MTQEAQELVAEKLSSETRESFLGYHMFQYYTENPYGWYLRYVRGLQPIHKKPALIMGSNIHDAIEILYKTKDKTNVDVFTALHNGRKDQYELSDQADKDHNDGLAMLKVWADTWLESDLRENKILHCEDQLIVNLSNGFKFTIRPDIVFQSKQDNYITAQDHKTTRYSVDASARTFEANDQATAYIYGLKQAYPRHVVTGIVCDVIYKRNSKVTATRPIEVKRTDSYLAQWELQAIGQLTELSQKVQALQDGWPPTMLFPRNGKDESFFSHEWEGVYHSALPADPTEAPYGYYIDTWTIDRIYELTQDLLSIEVSSPGEPNE